MSFKIEEDVEAKGKKISLLDLNGTKSNFETKFHITGQPGARYVVAIVSQDDLDNGNFNFEMSEPDGSFSRKIIRQDPEHQNYFIAIKRHPDADGGPEGVIKLHVIKQLRELPANESYALPPREIDPRLNNVQQGNLTSDSPTPGTIVEQQEVQPMVQNKQADVDYNTLFIVGVVFIVIAMVIFNKK